MSIDHVQFQQQRHLIDVGVDRAEQIRQVARDGDDSQRNRRAEPHVRAIDIDVYLKMLRPLYNQRIRRLRTFRPGDARAQVEGLHRRLCIAGDNGQGTYIGAGSERLARDPARYSVEDDAYPVACLADGVSSDGRPRSESFQRCAGWYPADRTVPHPSAWSHSPSRRRRRLHRA